MNYLHPQLFFPISLYFFPPSLRPLSFGWRAGPPPPSHPPISPGPDSPRENPTVNSAARTVASPPTLLILPVRLSVFVWDGGTAGRWRGGGRVEGRWQGGGAGVAACLWPSGRFKSIKAESPLSSSLLLGGTGTFGFINRER